ncbi:MAG TPA: hypothetical protein VMW73_09675 [Spirochaetia bacterium]|nr:hypothetical protein [Spirochaetia bacterium]
MQRIGDFFLNAGLMTAQQVEATLEVQRAGDKRRFGEIAFELGFVENNSLTRYAAYLEQNNEKTP